MSKENKNDNVIFHMMTSIDTRSLSSNEKESSEDYRDLFKKIKNKENKENKENK